MSNTLKDYYLAIDFGSTNCKCALVSLHGSMDWIESFNTPYDLTNPDVPLLLLEKAWLLLRKSFSKLIHKSNTTKISGISISSLGETIVPINKDGKILAPTIPWFAYQFQTYLPQPSNLTLDRVYQKTGLDIHPSYSAFAIYNLQQSLGSNSEIYRWLPVTSYIIFKLTGQFFVDPSIASRTMLYNLIENRWDQELLCTFDITEEQLPSIVSAGTPVGTLKSELVHDLGLSNTPVVTCGAHDQLCSFLSTRCNQTKLTLDSCGTAESLVTQTEKNSTLLNNWQGHRLGSWIIPNSLMLMAGIPGAGPTIDWFVKLFFQESSELSNHNYSTALQKAGLSPPGAKGILHSPHLRGAGCPYWNPSAKGALLGLRDHHSRGDLLRSALEGLSFELKRIILTRESIIGSDIPGLLVCGGGSKNILWQEIKASITEKPVYLSQTHETALMGAAILATGATNNSNNIINQADDWHIHQSKPKEIVPSKDLINYYRDRYEDHFLNLYTDLQHFN